MKSRFLLVVFAAGALLARAGTIVQYTAGTTPGSGLAWGESLMTPVGGPWNNITFNFYSDAPAVTPAAAGNAFLLTQEYLGTPAALSSSTPGFLAESVSNAGGVYTFNSGVVINPGTEYWIYEDAVMSLTGSNVDGSATEDLYDSVAATTNFASFSAGVVANFTLSGTAAVPEPGTLYLSICALIFALIPVYISRKKSSLKHASGHR